MVEAQKAYPSTFEGVVEMVAFLRGPKGCPWDREQTRDSLKRQFLEETYEVVEAIDRGDAKALSEELGDVLLHLAFQMRIAAERQEFTSEQAFTQLIEKLVRRHPHVFAKADASSAEQVEANWEELKRRERSQMLDKSAKGTRQSALDGVPKAMPALAYAQAVQVRASRVGFDWEAVDGLADKVAEEAAELKGARSDEEREAELGDLLFTLVNLCRWHKVDAEGALRKANARFYQRFTHMERAATEQGRTLSEMPMADKEALWQQAKGE
jgi:tetrapyrrole methylase family protein/MazG family protein